MTKAVKLLFAGLLLSGSLVWTQTDSAQPAAPSAPPRRGFQPEARLKHLSRALNLTDDQKEKLKPIFQDEAQQMQSLQSDSSLTQPQRRQKMRKIHESFEPQIQAVLTPEQQEKLNNMKGRGRGGHMGRRSGAGASGNTPDPSTPPNSNNQ